MRDGARVIAPMPTLDPAEARIGTRVHATYRRAGDEFGFVDFAPTS